MNADVNRSAQLAEFDETLKRANLLGQWKFEGALQAAKNGPRPYGIPHIWRWQDVHPLLMQACEVLPSSNDARRNLSFRNPATNGGAATQTVSIGMQAVLPGELCWAHRHSIDALRFGIVGDSRLYTVVNGERLPMEAGDLVLTPAYSWHDHHNEGDEVGIWLDVLNTPMMFALNQIFFEEFGEHQQPLRTSPGDYLNARGGLVRPAWERVPTRAQAYRYAWREVQALLHELSSLAGSPYDDLLLRYVNPFTGGSTLNTLDAYIQRLRPGFVGQRHRQTSSAVYYVVEGAGSTQVGETELQWRQGDSFCVPNWLWHEHHNASSTEQALLFVVSDAPTLQALGLYREEPRSTVRSDPYPTTPADRVRTDIAPMIGL